MQYIECPDLEPFKFGSVFLAGGITGCPDWQSDIVKMLESEDITIVNPRRKEFPINDPKAASQQIYWEYLMLRQVDLISFWFPKETLCPIALYELGAWSMTNKPIIIGVDPEYQRIDDIEIQTILVRPNIEMVHSLDNLSYQIINELELE